MHKSLLSSQGVINVEKLVDKIKLAKSGDDNAMMEIINQCSPMINKYTRMLNYDEDCRSELKLKLITLIKREIDIENLHCDNDGAIIGYISCALRHHYIVLSKAQRRIRDNEMTYDQDSFIDLIENNPQFSTNDTMENELLEILRSMLTEREFIYVKLIVIDGWTAESVAKKYGITKQAVNQSKKRGLEKLKTLYV